MQKTRRTVLSTIAAGLIAGVVAMPISASALTLGFAQVGAESEWRTANTQSIKDAAKAAGITLKFSDAQQKQENQIKAIRSFIAQKVDVIAFAPVVTTGWDTVLMEAKKAKIPVVLTDRSIETKDPSLYVTMIGSDFTEEGRKAAKWLLENYKGQGDVNIVELQGTVGSAPAIERKKGFEEVIKSEPRFKITRSQTGDFTRAKGKEVMEAFLKTDKNIQVLYAHNDDMAIGAMKQLHEHGVSVPAQVSVIGFDDIALAPYTIPALSSVKIPVTEMIQETIGRLIFMLDDGAFTPPKTFTGELIARDSVAPPASR